MSNREIFRFLGVAGAGALAAGVAPTGAHAQPSTPAAPSAPTAPNDDGKDLPPMPSAADLEAIRGLTSIGSLRETLLTSFPDSFGGLYSEGDKVTILTVGTAAKAEALSSFGADYMTTMVDADAPDVVYAKARHSLQALTDLRDEIAADHETWVADGVWGSGLDESENSVVVFVDQPVPGLADRLATTYGTDAVQLKVAAKPELLDRHNDVAPWNAGNMLVSSGTSGGQHQLCTSGFGFHDAAGHTWGSTAGHCGNWDWFNTNYFDNPSFSSGRHVGVTLNNYFGPSNSVDVQRIAGSTSKLFWKGGPNATRQWVAGVQNPNDGNTVCSEGSVGKERCGTVTATNINAGGQLGLFFVDGMSAQRGDSGGPIIWPTGYGFIAQGTVHAGDTQTYTLGQQINEQMFVQGLTVNSLSTGP